MPMRNQLAVHEWTRPIRIGGQEGVVLVMRLVNAAPEDLTRAEKKALRKAREAAEEVQRIMRLRARRRPENLQVEDRTLDAYWRAAHGMIEAWAGIAGDPNQPDAEQLLRSLFPGGLDFTITKYEVQVIESEIRLARIAEEGLEERLAALLHPDLLPRLRRAHQAFADKLGVGRIAVEIPDTRELLEAIRELSFRIADYARVVSASVDVDDEATVTRFRSTLAPLAKYRAETGGRSGSDEVDPETDLVDPEAPIPLPPDEPPPDEPISE